MSTDVHVMKATRTVDRVVGLSVAFNRLSINDPTRPFKNKLRNKLESKKGIFGKFKIYIRLTRRDFFIKFDDPCSEGALDRQLNTVAKAMNLSIAIEPGVNERQITSDLKNFIR